MRACSCTQPVTPINPRHSACERCAGQIPPDDRLRRDLDLERELTRQAAKGLVDPEPLIIHSETRCERLSGEYTDDHMLMAAGRDFRHDGREEIADCRWYITAWMQTHSVDDPDYRRMFLALRHTCLLYDLLSEEE